MEKEQRNKLFKMGLPIILGTILLIGVSYAWLTLTLNGTKTNVLKAGSLSLTLVDTATNGINVTGAVPMLDEVGVTTDPYTFTLTNNGTIESEYTIYLDDVALETNETALPDNAIKYNLVKDEVSMATDLLSTTGTSPNRVLETGVIPAGESYEYDLRLWIDQNATTAINGKVFRGTIRVEASQIIEEVPILATDESCFETTDNADGTVTIKAYLCGPTLPVGAANTNAVNNITDVVIPSTIGGKTVTGLYSAGGSYSGSAFEMVGLTSVVIPDTITQIGDYVFNYNTNLTSVTLPNSLTSIGGSAFESAKLSEITLPENLESIGGMAFSSNRLTSLVIPASVTTLGNSAFGYNQLTSVIFKGKKADYSSTAFTGLFGWESGSSCSSNEVTSDKFGINNPCITWEG